MKTDSPSPSLNARLIGLGISESYASLLANGHRTPSLELALKIQAELGIAPAAWKRGQPPAVSQPAPEAVAC